MNRGQVISFMKKNGHNFSQRQLIIVSSKNERTRTIDEIHSYDFMFPSTLRDDD
jgi:hypothetical protein